MANKRLFVGNLSYSSGEEDLLEAFADFQPQNARVIPNRGFGFIEVPEDQLEAAIAKVDGSTLAGRTIKVNEAIPRDDKPREYRRGGRDRGGRGGSGGRGGGRY